MIRDCKKSKSGDDFLKTYCGINLDNDDTGAITGSDAGGSKTKTAESIVPESGKLKNFKKNSFTVNGLTIQLANFDNDGNYLGDLNYGDLNDTQKYIWQALYTWWAKGALNLIAESYGDNFSFTDKSSATVKKMYFGFQNYNGNVGAFTGYSWDNNGKTISISMRVNMYAYSSLTDGGNPDGKSNWTSSYLDTMLAHEFTHAVLAANINYNAQFPLLITEGLAELTIGRDNSSDMLELASEPALLSKTLMSEEGNNPYGGGYMFLRYLARQAGDLFIINTSDSLVQTFRGNDDIRNFAVNAKINAGAGSDYIENYGAANVSINGGESNDSILSGGDKVSISGGSGNDSIYSGGDKVSISGGAGNDSIHSYGDKVKITGDAGDDSIYLYANATNHTVIGGKGNDSFMSYSTNGIFL